MLVFEPTFDEQLLETDQIPAVWDDPEQLRANDATVRAPKEHAPDLGVLARPRTTRISSWHHLAAPSTMGHAAGRCSAVVVANSRA